MSASRRAGEATRLKWGSDESENGEATPINKLI